MILIITVAIFVIANKDEYCNIDAKEWLAGIIGSYLADFILLMAQLHHLKKNRRENLCIMGLRMIVLTFLVGWLIYGNILYYDRSTDKTCGNGLRLIMVLILIYGYFEMLKCCCLGTCICILVPFIIFAVRRGQRPNWVPAPP